MRPLYGRVLGSLQDVKCYTYDAWGQLLSVDYADATPDIAYVYDAMGRQTSATDAVGTTTFTYDAFGQLTAEQVSGLYSKALTRHWDTFGRNVGYSVDGDRKQSITYGSATGRIAESDGFRWDYLAGSNLKSQLTYPNDAVVTWSYEPHRDLLTAVTNATYSTYVYTNDLLGRRTSKNDEQYGYNIRDELISADEVSYNYDDIGIYAPTSVSEVGNRTTAEGKTYTANNLNQYTAIDDFVPEYDADGNQTLVKTSTGIWSVTYNAENRPIRWQSGDTVITMAFDRMGRRIEMRTQSADSDTLQRFVYDNYLCVQQLRGADNTLFHSYVWDPTEPIATRPLIFLPAASSLAYYFHDGNKNVSEVFYHALQNGIAAHYDYAPFGAVSRTSRATRVTNRDLLSENPFRFSSEYHDATLGLVYYNYRHYNPQDGRWGGFDSLERGCANLYSFLNNNPVYRTDILGLMEAKSWAVGLCARNVGNFNPESVLFRIRSLNLEVYLRQWTHQYINRIVPDHHDVRVQTYPCEDCKGEPIETITRGFQADSFNDAIFEYLLSKVPFRSENGWVAGHVEDARSPGPCSMQCVPKERYEKVKNKIQRSGANRYHLMLYNCQTWAREQLQE